MTWITELDALLEAERMALLSADKNELTEILRLKEDLLARAGAMRSDEGKLDTVLAKSRRNHALIDAALSGLRQATGVVSRHRTRRQKITVYDHAGSKREISACSQSSMEKKA